MNEESVKTDKIYGLFVNSEFVMEGTYDELIKWVVQFEFDVKLKYGQHNVESLVNEWDNDTPNKILRAETDDSIIFFDVRLFEKNV